ncbi:50S ribosomal protein L11 methyltransferase [Helicobacter cholecystus]|uniref:Ribosomal protein L11 methyltransferase n=1 Tax=Helicobacter cholecystus TaxID=45498 RepID=A0A3D8IXX7_9HELI|nr:50S ribosomal protein L11 methyltransferase [Helicobacter cholecystus]RDU70122.1 50S ribosomal protein L11 methyltransferase [Helicobacter cholecystus]VEJ24700.1 ribosomal protein methyltransferase [Helicobacter cholecystus]
MKNSLDEEYFEILVQPQSFYEIFLDFITQNIQDTLEEISTPYSFEGYTNDLSAYDLSCFFPMNEQQYNQIIIRTTQSPLNILPLLSEFAKILSQRVGMSVDFGFGYKICKNQDWIEAYRQSIIPICVKDFYIRPSWHKNAQELGYPQKDIIIDPALAFGSGHHATTWMCIELLCEMNLKGKKLLDVGCGSGILSICAASLGAKVEICDTDEFAIKESEKNFALNSQTFEKSWVGSIGDTQESYEIIVANILAHILIAFQSDFLDRLLIGGKLILSGILQEYQEQVLEKFKNWEVEKILQKDEWIAIKLAKVK